MMNFQDNDYAFLSLDNPDTGFGQDHESTASQQQQQQQQQQSMDEFLNGDNFTEQAIGTGNWDLNIHALPQDFFDIPPFLPSAQLDMAAATHNSSASSSQPQTPTLLTSSSTPKEALPPKIGARFSKESLRVLRSWLATHNQHPFPTDDEREFLQRQTGLSKVQILNWLANARRRGKVPEYRASPRTQSPSGGGGSGGTPIDIPKRPGTPAPYREVSEMNPLERWFDSPPESEPATANAIARAVASGVPFGGRLSASETGSTPGSSAYKRSPGSSNGTSGSSDSTAYSFESGNSGPSTKGRLKMRRKKRAARRRNDVKTSLKAPMNTFQCTFCTDTFKTKHIWQRHEKSLHIALEKWLCAPQGPRVTKEDGRVSCIFCDQIDPDDAHIESHNFTACQERSAKERTFHRKDHLGQHLRLVHNVKPEQLTWQLTEWKMETPKIKSRCGFCGLEMDTWEARVDHLAEHFKMGSNMADWTGDWGFDSEVTNRIECSIAPYMIELERHAPFPFAASSAPLESPLNAYELIQLELTHFIETCYDASGRIPSADELQLDACRIIFAAEVPAIKNNQISKDWTDPGRSESWLRDLVTSSEPILQKARFSPLRLDEECRLSYLTIIGKENIFASCPLEVQLVEYVQSREGLPIEDEDLRREACQILRRMESKSTMTGDIAATWLSELAGSSSTTWLLPFRQRNCPLSTPEVASEVSMQETPNSSRIDSIIQNYNDLETRLSEYVQNLRVHSLQPTDADLRQMFIKAIDQSEDAEWKKTAMSNSTWLGRFKRRHLPWSLSQPTTECKTRSGPSAATMFPGSNTNTPGLDMIPGAGGGGVLAPSEGSAIHRPKRGYYLLNDPGFDRIVTRELARWVAATMSPHNPNKHVPSDEELRYQAKWIMFEDGDPWNITAADNPEWLRRFKRDVGIGDDEGPGLLELGWFPPGAPNAW